jgi:hypothetical protein
VSEALLKSLTEPAARIELPDATPTDPVGDDDLQLALYVCFELHYRSFADVDSDWEWEPHLLAARRNLERVFLDGVRTMVPERRNVAAETVGALLFDLAAGDTGPALSEYLHFHGTAADFREFAIHRSAYQLKEADPHTWAIPRLHGAPKAAMVEIQADEYGSGDPHRAHSAMFARTMDALGLDSSYGAYIDALPGPTLATVNLISALGLHRNRRGALVGHLAMFEITSAVPNSRYARAARRLGFDDAVEFYDEHVEADSVHENIAAYDLAQGLAIQQPALANDIVFGAESLLALEARFATEILDAWSSGRSSLRAAAHPGLA